MPTDPAVKELDFLTLSWFGYWLQRVEDEQFDRFEDILGTKWTSDDFVEQKQASGRDVDIVRTPLTTLLNPDLQKHLRKMFVKRISDSPGGIPRELAGTEIYELSELPKDEFMSIIGRHHLPSINKAANTAHPKPKR